jgi:hypothetical protein
MLTHLTRGIFAAPPGCLVPTFPGWVWPGSARPADPGRNDRALSHIPFRASTPRRPPSRPTSLRAAQVGIPADNAGSHTVIPATHIDVRKSQGVARTCRIMCIVHLRWIRVRPLRSAAEVPSGSTPLKRGAFRSRWSRETSPSILSHWAARAMDAVPAQGRQ